jgi:carboxyl-terminal processing protease
LTAFAAEPAGRPEAASPVPREFARRVEAVTDTVLDHHIDPPARQQMILAGLKAVYASAGVPMPADMARRVSALATPEQTAAFLAEAWPRPTAGKAAIQSPEDAFVHGMLAAVPGGGTLLSAKERKVAEQFAGNVYVGIQIALGLDEKTKRPQIAELFDGGPAQKAGALKGDLFIEVDGVDTEGKPLTDVIDRLRGEEGTKVVVKIRRPKTGESRTLEMTRGRLARPTITGVRKRPSGEGWDVRVDGPEPIGYLKVLEIAGSTPHELRQLARQLESEGARALVLDLRSVRQAGFHPTVLLADSLLGGGTLGRLRTAERTLTYQADADALFRDWPMAVLVDARTEGPTEWLAAALQDNKRGVLVGEPTAGRPDVAETVDVPSGTESITMTTGRLERADGRPMGRERTSGPGPASLPRVRNPREPDSRGGVKPDHLVGMRSGRMAMPRPHDEAAPGETRELSDDPAVAKALALLRKDLAER